MSAKAPTLCAKAAHMSAYAATMCAEAVHMSAAIGHAPAANEPRKSLRCWGSDLPALRVHPPQVFLNEERFVWDLLHFANSKKNYGEAMYSPSKNETFLLLGSIALSIVLFSKHQYRPKETCACPRVRDQAWRTSR